MTVISALITQCCTAHASDSLLTVQQRPNGRLEPIEWQRSKIVKVEAFRGAMAYSGLAEYMAYGWSTHEWLRHQAEEAHRAPSAEAFAETVAQDLGQQLARMHFPEPNCSGITIHFTAYGHVQDCWIPELFLITNWLDTSYSSLRPQGVGVSRETYHNTTPEECLPAPEHREPKFRYGGAQAPSRRKDADLQQRRSDHV